MNTQELLWKYAEGHCTHAEQAEIEQLIAANPGLKDELTLIQNLQSTLKGMEPEQPSMRFAQNVMEALPNLYTAGATEPLISPFWKKVFWATLMGGLGLAVIFFRSPQPSSGIVSDYSKNIASGISATLQQIPAAFMQYFVMVFLAVAALVLLDKLLAASKLREIG